MTSTQLTVEEFTTPNPVTADEDTGIEELGQLMREHGIRHLPITRGEQVVGVVSQRDLAVLAGLDLGRQSLVRAGDLMSPEPVTVRASDPLDQVAYRMSELKIGSVIVLEEDGSLYGIFTATDALNALIEVMRGMH
ncbi:MAG: CBS domain-containing protein [Chromatiales bacterium]|nr:CBS domain-containing protein [Chromatiales bacterium]